jgi:hypothetical protein
MAEHEQKNQGREQNLEGGGHKQDGGGDNPIGTGAKSANADNANEERRAPHREHRRHVGDADRRDGTD